MCRDTLHDSKATLSADHSAGIQDEVCLQQWVDLVSRQQGTYRGTVYKVMDVIEGHGEGVEGQHHALLHIALLEAVAGLAHAAPSALQLRCRQPMAHCRLPCKSLHAD